MESTRSSRSAIVVTGDITIDWNIAHTQHLENDELAWNAVDSTHAYWQRGGAALLADLINAIADKLHQSRQTDFNVLKMKTPENNVTPSDDQYHHSYAIWSLFNYEMNTSSHKDEKQAWRVKEFMGLRRSKANNSQQTDDWKRVVDDTAEADIVVLDDANLGFRDRRDLWPKAITTEGYHPWILLKMARPVAQGSLWEHLYSYYADRLIVVMTVNDLRLSEVQISRELSWEQTGQDLAWELAHNPYVNALSLCAHTVILFPTAGAVLLSRPKKEEMAQEHAAPECRLFFDPRVIEGMWEQNHPGSMIGYTSCFAASIVHQLMISLEMPNIKQGILSGLSAMRKLHLEGYGVRGSKVLQAQLAVPITLITEELAEQKTPGLQFAEVEIQKPLRRMTRLAEGKEKESETSFWTILEDRYKDTLSQVARQIVLEGAEKTLEGVPLGQFGRLLTVDRREIESFRSIRTLIGEYYRKSRQKRPLSIAVFGAPGSGKSFGITELAKSLLPGQIKVLEYNLSQFKNPEELIDALHQVRDVGLSGLIPIVFWDEFDTSLDNQPLVWLRHFLAPMQDGCFQEGQISHPIGRSIFVFAGGVNESMEIFTQKMDDKEFREAKGPDFASRLKGYVNILGPNRQEAIDAANTPGDPYFIIRRAILLRSILLRDAPHLFENKDDVKVELLNIDAGVVGALLHTSKYKHGVRSMESIIAMSLLTGKRRFERSCLPAVAQLDLHVDATDFQTLVQRIELEGKRLEILAEAVHEVFRSRLRAQGYSWGPQTNDELKTHSSLVPFSDLPQDEKKQNRDNAQDIPRKLDRVGYAMIPLRSGESIVDLPTSILERLAEMEHERWLMAKLEASWHWATETDKGKKLHKDLLPWHKLSDEERAHLYTPPEIAALGAGELPESEKEKDRDLVRGIPQILASAGYTAIKVYT